MSEVIEASVAAKRCMWRVGWMSKTDYDALQKDLLVYSVNSEMGIPVYPDLETNEVLSRWERKSTPLKVSSHYRNMFTEFRQYLEDEMKVLMDADLTQEVDVLRLLIDGN